MKWAVNSCVQLLFYRNYCHYSQYNLNYIIIFPCRFSFTFRLNYNEGYQGYSYNWRTTGNRIVASSKRTNRSTKTQEKNNRFPLLDILGYSKNTYKNPKFGKVRQVPTRKFPTKFLGWGLSHSSKLGIFVGIL